ncbi:hypothetical protein RDI58_015014 [Solanum bulbocastanum]|uniref:DUF4283 domain-containing protein n=1 Tax=Solanum bulbocastanum TaxID=147425 RepID=A0AAN8YB52_SOLBU
MALSSSPQPMAEGEAVPKPTYAAQIISKTPTQLVPKTQLKSIKYVLGESTLQFMFKELDEFATEEGLHQAIVMKFSYGALEIQELRSILLKQFAIKVLWHQSGYIQFNGKRYGYRTFQWTLSFNPKEETSRALAWLSMPSLPTSDARRILNEKRGLEEVIQRDNDKNPSTCTKNNVLAITESSKPDDAMHNNSSPILVQKNPQAQAGLNYDLLAEKTSNNEAQGVVEVQNNLVNIKTTVGNQVVPIDNVPIGIATVEFDNVKEKSSVAIGIERESDKALGGTSKNRGMPQLWKLLRHHNRQHLVVGQGKHAKETEHEATQRVEKSNGEVFAQHSSKGWNVVALKKTAATSTNIRWANMVEEEEEHVTTHSKLSPGAPAFVPKGSSIAYVSFPLH